MMMPAETTYDISVILSFVFAAEKKQDMLIRGRKELELDEKYGFAVENNVAALQLNVSVGLQVGTVIKSSSNSCQREFICSFAKCTNLRPSKR